MLSDQPREVIGEGIVTGEEVILIGEEVIVTGEEIVIGEEVIVMVKVEKGMIVGGKGYQGMI